MKESRLPEFGSLEELVEHFETHDMSESFDDMPEVQFDIDIQRRSFLISVDQQLMKKLIEAAQAQHTSAGRLVNLWLEEKVAEPA